MPESSRHDLLARLGIAHPIIQAPMAGGATTPALVAAASEAGTLGSLAAAYLEPDRIAALARDVRARTARPFGINLFAPLAPAPGLSDDRAARALQHVARVHAELGLPAPTLPGEPVDRFDAELAAALESGATILSFTFGLLPEAATRAAKARGLFLIGTATTVDEARALEAAGVDAVCAQGSEAGGHRGTFLPHEPGGGVSFASGLIGTMALVPQIVDAVRLPVIAAGGIMDGRGIAAALALGACAAQMGTAFLTCDESGAPEPHKAAILTAADTQTRITRAFSGRPARGIVNRFMTSVEGDAAPAVDAADLDVLPFPRQGALLRAMRAAAIEAQRGDLLPLFAGQGHRLARRESVAQLIARLVAETAAAQRGASAIALTDAGAGGSGNDVGPPIAPAREHARPRDRTRVAARGDARITNG